MTSSRKMALAIAISCLALGLVTATPHQRDKALNELLVNIDDDLDNLNEELENFHDDDDDGDNEENRQRSIEEINMKHGLNDDIVYPDGISKRAFMRDVKQWPMIKGKVKIPYVLDVNSKFTRFERKEIKKAMKTFEDKTCIRFEQGIPRTGDRHYISIFKGRGCWSYIGKVTNRNDFQQLSLGRNCVHHGIIQHELMHALGFHHEQNRPDRDNYVKIRFENILKGMEHNFQKQEQADTQKTKYDYGSVMHYGAYAFSKNKQPTIVSKKPNVTFGQREGLSDLDLDEVKKAYKCAETTNPATQSPVGTTRKPATSKPSNTEKPQPVHGDIISGCDYEEGKESCGGCEYREFSRFRSCKNKFIWWCPRQKHKCGSRSRVRSRCPDTCGLCGEDKKWKLSKERPPRVHYKYLAVPKSRLGECSKNDGKIDVCVDVTLNRLSTVSDRAVRVITGRSDIDESTCSVRDLRKGSRGVWLRKNGNHLLGSAQVECADFYVRLHRKWGYRGTLAVDNISVNRGKCSQK